jgi:hypothetical protein
MEVNPITFKPASFADMAISMGKEFRPDVDIRMITSPGSAPIPPKNSRPAPSTRSRKEVR